MLIGVIGTLGYNFNVTIPLIARFVLDSSPEEFGLLTSALGAGSLFAALWLAAAGARSERFLVGASLAFSVLFLVLALSEWYWVTAAGLLLVGFAGISLMTGANTTLQLEAPEEMRGRMISIYMFLMAGSTPIGGFLTGFLADLWGVRTALGIEAVGCFLGVALALWFRRARERGAPLVPVESRARV
jgi:MFS family permease